MNPIDFNESNKTLKPPIGMEDECGNLDIYTNGEVCVSLWKLSLWERIKVLFHGNIWLFVWSGTTQPPVALEVDKSVFKEVEQNKLAVWGY